MMITLHPGPGQSIGDLLREVRDVADDDRPLTTGHGGLDVDEDLALAYLTARRSTGGRGRAVRDPAPAETPTPTEGTPTVAPDTDPAATPKTDRRTTETAEPEPDPAAKPRAGGRRRAARPRSTTPTTSKES
ncbi:hypothetical protein [Micromonospora sp. WMMC273]|uniref:hypothetical protein n=1 Tax=Micromonospora sp. WMMC273 TaxID=3015157 RepID=UPI0022B713B1|nr:hypothetical protein [Micromonospora sp. WMMC273]MCZ7478887.1 hypothetical protein [Micromonospora sp. WMMC273]